MATGPLEHVGNEKRKMRNIPYGNPGKPRERRTWENVWERANSPLRGDRKGDSHSDMQESIGEGNLSLPCRLEKRTPVGALIKRRGEKEKVFGAVIEDPLSAAKTDFYPSGKRRFFP